MEQIGENTWSIIGNVELLEIEQTLDLDLGCEEVDTFTGLVFDALGMIPNDGEQDIELEFKGLMIRIQRIEDHQIALATVVKPEAPAEEEEDD